jgi:hypothetical protein
MELRLKKFDMASLSNLSVVVAIGKRKSGKSFLVRDILSRQADTPLGLVVSGTEIANKFFGKFIPGVFIHYEFNSKVMDSFVKRQTAITKKWTGEIEASGKSNLDPHAFVVLDDLGFDAGNWTKDKSTKYLFMNGRHIKAFFLITLQYALGLKPELRTNIDYTFIFREPNVRNRRVLYENFAGMFPTFDVFQQVMDQCTNNYECLVINNMATTNDITEQVFWYKADPAQEFKMCSPQYWALSAQAANDEDEPAQELYDIEKFRKSRSQNVKVKKCH